MTDIFISYSRADRPRIEKLAASLEAEGFDVWWDRNIAAGTHFTKETEAKLNEAKAIIVAWSLSSIESMWVADEADIGKRNGKLVPISIDAVEPAIGFRQIQTLAFNQWRGDQTCSEFKELVETLKIFTAGDAPQKELTSSAANGVSLIILPFQTISIKPEDKVLCDAIHEDLTTQLARVKDYFVISRNTAAVYGRRDTVTTELGRELGVNYALEGSVRRSDDSVRVTAQLIDAVSGELVAALNFDRPASELLSLQNDLIAEIVTHLGSEINLAQVRRIQDRAGVSPSAFESMTCARVAIAEKGWNEKGIGEAIRHLTIAVEKDPDYAPAIANLALLRGLAIINNLVKSDVETEKSEIIALARRALDLDRQSSDVLGFAGCALCDVGNIDEGVPHLERAIEIDPSNAQAHAAYGWSKILQGNVKEGVAEMSAATRISPKQPGLAFWLFGLATGYNALGEIDMTANTLERALRTDPTFVAPYFLLAEVEKARGNPEAVEGLLRRAAELQ